jgi:hypothetical protein
MFSLYKYLTTPAISEDAASLILNDKGRKLFYELIEKRKEYKRNENIKLKKQIEIIEKKILDDFGLTVE